jgi:GT2 family glycosyltransferase
MTLSKYSISVVIPNYNGKDLIEKNIPFVIRALATSHILDSEIIISDDNSNDDSVLFIKNNYPDIILICNVKNKGFSGNTNMGILSATKDLVLILNSDVELTDNYFVPLVSFFDKPDTFGVMSRIIAIDSEKIQEGSKYPDCSYGNIVGKNFISNTQSTLYSLYLTGANALVNREKLLQVGCFTEIYNPYYWEDEDLSIKAWRMGYKVYYENTAVCRHPTSSTIKKESSKKVRIVFKRNKMYFHFLHLNGIELYYFIFKTSIKTPFKFIMGDIYYMKSFYLFIRSIPRLRTIKKAFTQQQLLVNRNITMKEIVKYIKGSIIHSEIVKF